MQYFLPACRLAAALLVAAWVWAPPAAAGGKPKLSGEIQSVIEARGVAAARQRFAELYPAQADDYDIDLEGMANLGQQYMIAGDMEKGMAVMEMSSLLAQQMTASMMSAAPSGSAQVMAKMQEQERLAQEQQAREREMARQEEQAQQRQTEEQRRGKARSDLDRFTGVYGPPGSQRTLWVMQSCDGYLVSGASWGGAASWWLRSAADAVFTYEDSFQSFSMEFVDGPGGMQMRHDLQIIASPLRRQGPVPADWGECLERPLR